MKIFRNIRALFFVLLATAAYSQTTVTTPGGMVNKIPIFTGTAKLGDSNIYQNGSNIGIGTTTPTAPLTISANFGGQLVQFTNSSAYGASSGAGFLSVVDNGTAVTSGARLGYYLMGGAANSSHGINNSVGITGVATQNWSGTAAGAALSFVVQPNNTAGAASRKEALRIDQSGYIGIGTATPAYPLDVNGAVAARDTLSARSADATTSTAYNSPLLLLSGSAYNSSSHTAVAQRFAWQVVPSGNNTASPSASLKLLYSTGTVYPAATGLSIAPNGIITFASGQTFPGGSGGTITGVTAGTGLTGGGASGAVTLGIDTAAVPLLGANNIFSGVNTFTGSSNTFSHVVYGSQGIYGQNYNSGNPAVEGDDYSYNGVGVEGLSFSGDGVSTTGYGGVFEGYYGLYAYGSQYAGEFIGNVYIGGTLSKAGGSFKIDDPIDPENKYLSHSFVESPDMMNVYNGNVTTDGGGFATVTMPDWFEALNQDFRYQLTVIGQFAQAIVSREIDHSQFVIQTDKPGVKVSWQVTGIRHDKWANAHRIPVEEDKSDADKGQYLHPELFGHPEAMAIGSRPHKAVSPQFPVN